MPAQIIIENPNLGGIADSKYLGVANSVAMMVGLDIHSEPGIIKVNQKLSLEYSPDAPARSVVNCSDGYTYFFLTNGKILKRGSVGFPATVTYTVVRTVSPSAGTAEILDAMEYDGFVYYATANRLGRWEVADPTHFDDNWKNFRSGNTSYHPMMIQNLVLFIGDSELVAQVEKNKIDASGTITASGTAVTGTNTFFTTEAIALGRIYYTDANDNTQERKIVSITDNTHLTIDTPFDPTPSTASTFQLSQHIFSAGALDLPKPYIVTALGIAPPTDLLVGTTPTVSSNRAKVFRWNTWSISFTSEDEIPEPGINSFLQTDNFILVSAGQNGGLYQYSSDVLQLVKRIPGNWVANRYGGGFVRKNATANILGLPLFGFSNKPINGGGAMAGVWSFGNINPSMPKVLNYDFRISTDDDGLSGNGVNIDSMEVVADANSVTLLVAWSSGSTYGIDAIDWTAKYSGAYLDTRVIANDRNILKRVAKVEVPYRLYPAGSEIQVWYTANNGGSWTQIDSNDVVDDTNRQLIQTNVGIDDLASFQVRVKLIENPSHETPEVEKTIITFE